MATCTELNEYYKQNFGKDFPKATLSRWVKNGKLRYIKEGRGYNYNFDDFKELVNSSAYKKRSNAASANPKDYIGKQCGYLLIVGIVPKEEYREKNYCGTLMYCTCLKCGKEKVQVRLSYLTGNGNYTQETCGCARKERAFLATTRQDITSDFLENFNDFDKFLFIHKMLIRTTEKYYFDCDIEEYKKTVLFFYSDKQFNAVYDFWNNIDSKLHQTFYDWAKPSLDHIVPKSKGGNNKLENLQVLTVFENLAKRDMTQEEWVVFKNTTNTKSDYFIENIMKEGEY